MQIYHIPKVTEPVPLDGVSESSPWDTAQWVVMKDAVTGEETKQRTEFALLYDEGYLYAAYRAEDENILATFTQRDEPLYEQDVVELFMSPACSPNFYYEFNFSPNGVIYDAIVLNDNGRAEEGRGKLCFPIKEWNCEGLRVRTVKEKDSWSVTAAIPFAELHFARNRTPRSGERWRANLYRIEYGLPEPEYSAWSPPLICDFHTSEMFGTVVFE